MRFYAKTVEPYGPEVGVIDITTRQNIQLRGVTLEDGPAMLLHLTPSPNPNSTPTPTRTTTLTPTPYPYPGDARRSACAQPDVHPDRRASLG